MAKSFIIRKIRDKNPRGWFGYNKSTRPDPPTPAILAARIFRFQSDESFEINEET